MIWVRVTSATGVPPGSCDQSAGGGIAAATGSLISRSGGRLSRFAPPAMRCRPLLVWRHLLAHDIEEVVSTGVAEKPELALQISDRRVEAAVGTEITAEAAVLGIELEQRLRVIDRPLELRSVPDHALVSHQSIDVRGIKVRHGMRLEPGKRLANALPLRIDHPPADPALEYRPRDRLKIPGQVTRPRALRCVIPRHHRPQACCCSNIAANGRASKNACIDAIFPSRTVYHSATGAVGIGTVCRS